MNTSTAPIPRIERLFRDLSQENIAEVEQFSMLLSMGWSGAFSWDRLLESQRILLVSEAGAGKTYECRKRQEMMWVKGEPAFYIDLAQLASCNLHDLLSIQEEERFDAWLASQSDVATFFLDSIDELKLTLGSFEVALKRLSKAVSGQFGRISTVITTRPIPVDRQLINKYLPIPTSEELAPNADTFADVAMGRQRRESNQQGSNAAPAWRNVALMPLSDKQIREMAVIEGVDDPDALLADIRARNAEDFARRPQDLIELCADWRDQRRIRTHREQVSNNIRVKLKPRTDRTEPSELSPDKAFDGASRLALAAILTRKLTIRHSVEADKGGEPGTALDPDTILHDWTREERKTLLERSLFSFASYGRVRFHHRSVVEFLAAQRLDDRLSQGMPIKAVKRLLFAQPLQGINVVRPTMRPVAAWLAATRPDIFGEVCSREPDVLLDHADPESLSIEQRVNALRSYVGLYGQGGWRGIHVPRVQVQRFASTDLADYVLKLWRSDIENPEIREFLLEIIAAAPLPTCADIAYGVAVDKEASIGERLDAITALTNLKEARVSRVVQSILDSPELWPDRVVRGGLAQLFPRHISPDQLCQILQRINKSTNSFDELVWRLSQSIAEFEFAPAYMEALRANLTNLVTEGLVWEKKWPHLVSKYAHLLPVLAAVCQRLLHDGDTGGEVLRSSVIALRLQHGDHSYDDSSKNLRKELTDIAPFLREALFWADDAFCESLHHQEDAWRRLVQVTCDGPLDFNGTQDSGWVQRILSDPNRQLQERRMMLEASMGGIWDGVGDRREHIEGLKSFVGDVPEFVALIDSYLAPRKLDPESAQLEAEIKRRQRENKEQQERHHAEWIAFWHEVAEHPETAFSSDREGDTAWNLWQVMRRTGTESRATGWNRRFLEQHFGKEVADRLRIVMRSVWRKGKPTLRSERPANERNTILMRWELGLAAITAEAEDIHWASKLSYEEAEIATRYAPIKLNGFPFWFESLAQEHPETVERTLGTELSSELGELAQPNSFIHLLQDVSNAPESVVQLFMPRLRAWLDAHEKHLREGENEAAAKNRLRRVLRILIEYGTPEDLDHIRVWAEGHLKSSGNRPLALIWLATLIRLDPIAGVDACEHLLNLLKPEEMELAVELFGTLFGNRNSDLLVDLRVSGFTVKQLLRLVLLAYKFVRPTDDIVHEGAYSPDSRDMAQDGRNALLKVLLETKGSEAWAVKLEMAADPLFAHFKDRLRLLAYEKAAEEADEATFSEPDVAIFDQYGEAPPSTRDDMFALVVDRLEDLEDLLLRDDSPRAAWAEIKAEKIMRQLIAHELQHMSNHVYTVDQEAVTADEKETDIRLRVAASGQQATIELKIGESYSGRQLRDTIMDQLVTKYMAAESCRSGCLVVSVASDHRWKHPDTSEMLDSNGLQSMLKDEAVRIMDELGGTLRLQAKVLDLRPRLSSENSTN